MAEQSEKFMACVEEILEELQEEMVDDGQSIPATECDLALDGGEEQLLSDHEVASELSFIGDDEHVMDDEHSDWLSAADEETAPAAAEETKEGAAAAAGPAEPPAKTALQLAREILAQYPAEEPKPVYKHWARPRFLQYDYLYHYMHNYYDDYIDYLDRRMRGYEVQAPRPQTWAERALRTYTRNTYPHSVTYNVPVPKQKSWPHEPHAPPHRLSYFRSATSTLISTDTRLITKSRLYETRPPKPDAALLHTPHWANTWHSEHSKDYYNRKYKAILF